MIRKGTYILFMTFNKPVGVVAGALGECRLDPGDYCYVGSAMGGLDQRVSRHLRGEKTVRWHVDYLTIKADGMRAYESYPDFIPECELGRIAVGCGASSAIEGFGCSDCKCRTHLFRTDSETERRIVEAAGLNVFCDER
jgi:Uri superfamily endonuclease